MTTETPGKLWFEIEFYNDASQALFDYGKKEDEKSFSVVAELMLQAYRSKCLCFICEKSEHLIGGGVFVMQADRPIGGLVCLDCVNSEDIDDKFHKAIERHFADGQEIDIKAVHDAIGHA